MVWRLRLVRRGCPLRHGDHHRGGALTLAPGEAKALIFDFGGPVLLTPFELRHVGERSLGLPPGAFAWTGPFDPGADADWRSFQAGGMNEREYWARRSAEFGELTGEPATMPALCAHLYSGSEDELVRPAARRLIDDAKAAGIPVGVLTNDLTSFHDQEWLARMGVLRDFDVLVDGRTEGVYKPDRRAYEIVIERMGVDPATTIFIDDQPVNLDGADVAGLTPVRLDPTDPAPGFRLARTLLGLPQE
ncbi:MAG: HAD-IA family hydrolase [Candidatus Nanopelagicales bacterium]|nr:HAD-IA family hydrolase [Candidatus Nanopelagicales bacterium]MCF8543214.1 HAD-IA family hydrolase [Candidatus Nanopelagicales bacterium]MCF8558118.1 HAD-IA family hydrolase [Candidatus Nanopelagicales bacterium]